MELWNYIYEKTKAPMTPLYGGFPVKLTTHLGDPIDPADFQSADELRAAAVIQMQKLIKKHQRLPGSIYQAIKDRFEAEAESEEEDFIECLSEDGEDFDTSLEDLASLSCDVLSDSGCVSVASVEDEADRFFPHMSKISSIAQLPNGRLVMLGARLSIS